MTRLVGHERRLELAQPKHLRAGPCLGASKPTGLRAPAQPKTHSPECFAAARPRASVNRTKQFDCLVHAAPDVSAAGGSDLP